MYSLIYQFYTLPISCYNKWYSSFFSVSYHYKILGIVIFQFSVSLLTHHYGLNVCVPPNSHVAILTKGNGVNMWVLWEVIRSWEWRPHEWNLLLLKTIPQSSLALSTTWGYKKSKPGRGLSPDQDGTLIWDIYPPEPWAVIFCCT